MGHRFRVVLVGYGARGRSWQTELRSHPDFETAVVVDPHDRPLAAARAEGLQACSDLAEALSGTRADAALIASPPTEHVRDAITCLRAGIAVLVEKPLATSSEDAALVAHEAQSSELPVLVAQNFRYLPREAALRTVLEQAGLGRILAAEVESRRPKQPPRSGLDVGSLWDFVLHHLDVLRFRVGRLPDGVTAKRRGEGIRETWEISFLWTGGPSISYRHREGGRYRYRERIDTTHGRIVVGDSGVRFRRRRRLPGRVRPPDVRAERLVLDELAGAMRGAASGLDARDNLETIALVEAVERSALTGRTVQVESPARD